LNPTTSITSVDIISSIVFGDASNPKTGFIPLFLLLKHNVFTPIKDASFFIAKASSLVYLSDIEIAIAFLLYLVATASAFLAATTRAS